MDSITQAVLGASVGIAICGKDQTKRSAMIGAILGTVPDLDVLFYPFISEIEKISFHRGYSHSLLFSFSASFIFAYFIKRLNLLSGIQYSRLWFYCFLILLTHILLDVFTTYGTQIFLPFSDLRVSLDSIGIVDPIYSLPLLAGLLICLFAKNNTGRFPKHANSIGLIVSTCYLIFTLVNKGQIEKEYNNQLMDQNIHYEKLLTVPVYAGNMKWYGVAKSTTHLYLGKYSKIKNNKIAFHAFPINDNLLKNLDLDLVAKMKWFSKGFYTVAEKDGTIRLYNMQCDMQGVRTSGEYRAPTKFYYEITPLQNGNYRLSSGMHEDSPMDED